MKQSEKLDRVTSARLLRRDLKAAFPGTKFSVRLGTGTSWTTAYVSWEAGPTGDEVRRRVVSRFEGNGFDGRDDSTTFLPTSIELDGQTYRSGLGLICCDRSGMVA